MEKGHIGPRELIVLALLVIGVVAAVYVFTGGIGNQARLAEHPESTEESSPDVDIPGAVAPPPAENATAPAVTGAVPAAANMTNETIGALLDDGLARGDARFYQRAISGEFEINTFRWAMSLFNESPDAIPVKQNDLRALSVRFNGRYEDSLRGFAFKTYGVENADAAPLIYGVAVFLANSSALDQFAANPSSTFTVQYDPHPEGTQIIEGCSILSSEDAYTVSGSALKIYDVNCTIMYGEIA